MSFGLAPVGPRPHNIDLGKVDPAILRAMMDLLFLRMGPELAQRMQLAAGLVGIAGLWTALVSPGRASDRLARCLQDALDQAERKPDQWRRLGSDLCSIALNVIPPGHMPPKKNGLIV